MRKFTFIKSLFLAVALLAGNAVWGQTKTYNLVTSTSDLEAGGKYLIVGGDYALGLQNSNNRASVSVTINSNTISAEPASNTTDSKPFEITLGGISGAWTLYDQINTGYLYAGSSSSNHLKIQSSSSNWTITFNGNEAILVSAAQTTRNILRFNGSNNPPLFSCYSSGQNPVFLYKLQSTTSTQVATPQISATGVQKATDDYYNSATVTLSSTTDGASIYYTTNGDAPTTASTAYTAPFEITATSTIKAIATKTDMDNSAVAEKTITITELVAPTLTVTELTVPAMTVVTGLTDTETVNVSGAALTADILVTIDGADAAMFSVLPASIAQTAGTASGAVTVTYSPTAPGTHTATLKFNSTGATEVTRTLTGTSTMATPVAIDGSGVSQTGFTANWNAVAGATEYTLNVYTKTEGTATESNFGFEGSTALPSGWTGDGYVQNGASNANTGTYYAGMNAANKYIKTDLLTDPTSISFYYRYSSATANNTVKIQVSTDGSEWTDKGSYIATGSGATTTYVPTSIDLNLSGNYYIQFIMTSRSGGSFYFDDVKIISGTASSSTPIPGSPFTVTGETSKAIADLTAGTTYYYTVVAKNGSVATAVSNEVAVTTSTGTGLSNTVKNMNLRAVNGNIVLNAEAGQLVEVYNSIGQKVGSRLTGEGVNTIPARVKGVVFVKIGSEVSKLIME